MNKTPKRPMTREDASGVLIRAKELLQDTDGCAVCMIAVRVNLTGQMELFTPTVSPESIPTDLVISMVRAYLSVLEQGLARPYDEAQPQPQFHEIAVKRSLGPRSTSDPRRASGHLPGQKPGKYTVN